jgi:hypothetical protein
MILYTTEVIPYVLNGQLRVEVARRQADEKPGYPPTPDRVDLACHWHILVGQPGHHRGDQLGLQPNSSFAQEGFGHASAGDGGDGVDFDVVLGALQGEHPGETDEPHLGGAVVRLAEIAEDS